MEYIAYKCEINTMVLAFTLADVTELKQLFYQMIYVNLTLN